MSNRDDYPRHDMVRHLQLVETESPEIHRPFAIPDGRVRMLKTPAKPQSSIHHEVEIRVQPERDATRAGPSSVQGAVDRGNNGEEFDRLALICARIASGYYNSTHVLKVVAQRVRDSGEIGAGDDAR